MGKFLNGCSLAAVILLVTSGCSKNAEEATPEVSTAEVPVEAPAQPPPTAAAAETPAPEVLPGAADVRAAMANNEFERAVSGFLALKGLATGEDRWMEYRMLYGDVNAGLINAAQTNAQAAQALGTLRAFTSGR